LAAKATAGGKGGLGGPAVKKMAKDYRTEIAAASSSMVATIIAYPLDFVKSRMQGYQIDVKTAVLDAYRKEGPRAFWRGVVPPTLSIAFVRTLSFKCFSTSKYWLDDHAAAFKARAHSLREILQQDHILDILSHSPTIHQTSTGTQPSLRHTLAVEDTMNGRRRLTEIWDPGMACTSQTYWR
jgi:hypothetical protein